MKSQQLSLSLKPKLLADDDNEFMPPATPEDMKQPSPTNPRNDENMKKVSAFGLVSPGSQNTNKEGTEFYSPCSNNLLEENPLLSDRLLAGNIEQQQQQQQQQIISHRSQKNQECVIKEEEKEYAYDEEDSNSHEEVDFTRHSDDCLPEENL